MKDAKELYKVSPAPTIGKKTAFAFEHCWVVLKNQPKWSMPKERSKGLPQTPSSTDQVDSNDDNTMEVERPNGRKAKKAKRKRIDGDKGFDDYLAKILEYLQESHEQDREALASKWTGFKWMLKELILKRKGFVLKLLGRRKEMISKRKGFVLKLLGRREK